MDVTFCLRDTMSIPRQLPVPKKARYHVSHSLFDVVELESQVAVRNLNSFSKEPMTNPREGRLYTAERNIECAPTTKAGLTA